MTVDIATSTIVAQAFRMMEVSAPSSFGDDSEQARAAAEQYSVARDMILEFYDWSSARELANLPPLTSAAADPHLPFAYSLPADALVLRHVYDAANWRLDGRVIRTDHGENLTIRYTRQISRETDLPKTLQTAIAAQLADLLAPRFVGDRAKRMDIKRDLATLIKAAQDSDASTASHHKLDPDQPNIIWTCEAIR